jgi:SpoVK/Ycf46/Vps4 family AAA+-type ATPase
MSEKNSEVMNDDDELNAILASVVDDDDVGADKDLSVPEPYYDDEEEDDRPKKKNVFSNCKYSQMSESTFTLCGPTSDTLDPGVFSMHIQHGGKLIYTKIPVKIENLVQFPDSTSETIITEITKFWEREDMFKKFKLPYKRGILLWGPAGSGKSSTIQIIMKDVIDRDGVVFLFNHPATFITGYNSFRKIQPETPVVVIMEDIDDIIRVFGEHDVLNILDGVHKVNKTIFLACHTPDTRILTTDLKWVPAKDISEGDEIWALDEHRSEKQSLTGRETSRKFKKGKVISSFTARKECVRVHLDTGESYVCTVDHPWLSSGAFGRGGRNLEWQQAKDLLERPDLCRPFIPWETDESWEAGWIAGMLDGEGNVRYGREKQASGVAIVQTLGKTANKMKDVITKYCNFSDKIRKVPGNKDQLRMISVGGFSDAASLIGRVRADRLINKFDFSGTIVQNNHPAKVVRLELIGMQEIQSIETDAHTYFAEGFAVHNTTNYPEKLKARVVNRPSRFDKRFKIGFPNEDCRAIYLNSIKGDQDVDIDQWVKDTEGFSFAHLKELFVATKVLGDEYDAALATLLTMRQRISTDEKEEFDRKKVGFNSDKSARGTRGTR